MDPGNVQGDWAGLQAHLWLVVKNTSETSNPFQLFRGRKGVGRELDLTRNEVFPG